MYLMWLFYKTLFPFCRSAASGRRCCLPFASNVPDCLLTNSRLASSFKNNFKPSYQKVTLDSLSTLFCMLQLTIYIMNHILILFTISKIYHCLMMITKKTSFSFPTQNFPQSTRQCDSESSHITTRNSWLVTRLQTRPINISGKH